VQAFLVEQQAQRTPFMSMSSSVARSSSTLPRNINALSAAVGSTKGSLAGSVGGM
jgi:hypothetical protein